MRAATCKLKPAEMLAAWDPEAQRLHLRAPSSVAPGDRATFCIELVGSQVLASVAGAVLGVVRDGGSLEIELAPDGESRGAVRMLLAAARGERVPFSRRPPRYLIRLPATVSFRDTSRVLATTESVSEGGCGLAWSGRPPEVGRVLRVRLEGGPRPAENQGAVCWSTVAPAQSLAGVQFAGSRAPAAWSAFVAAVARSGAPQA
jgi:hypothetical protein